MLISFTHPVSSKSKYWAFFQFFFMSEIEELEKPLFEVKE
jgi:hypothetical protein